MHEPFHNKHNRKSTGEPYLSFPCIVHVAHVYGVYQYALYSVRVVGTQGTFACASAFVVPTCDNALVFYL